LGAPIAKIRVLNIRYTKEEGKVVRTTGEYIVVLEYVQGGFTPAQDLGAYLKNPIHDLPKNLSHNYEPNNS